MSWTKCIRLSAMLYFTNDKINLCTMLQQCTVTTLSQHNTRQCHCYNYATQFANTVNQQLTSYKLLPICLIKQTFKNDATPVSVDTPHSQNDTRVTSRWPQTFGLIGAQEATFTRAHKSCLLERHKWTHKGMSGFTFKTNDAPLKRTKCRDVYALTHMAS